METIFNAAGGLALFLLAMVMMTDGLKVFIGKKLKDFLQKWTSSPLRGAFSGALVTGIVQSSSAVTVATIGFVNAGVLSLQQALGVIFGANVGTTMTGWLVSLVGFGLKIESLAMPILAFGVALSFIAQEKRFQALGKALTGFGLFFLGLAVLKVSFSDVADTFGTGLLTSADIGSLFAFILAGFIATLLTQSSSAAIAIILMAASENVLGINAAAAAIIGANIGTTSTAMLAALNATPNAKRVAAGHVAFNMITGVIALIILPFLLVTTEKFGHLAGLDGNTVSILALFHTVFNILGVIIMLPFTARLARFLEGLFKTEEEDLSRPRYLDKTVAGTPALAVAALWQELIRLNGFVCAIALAAIKTPDTKSKLIKKKADAAFSLGQTINEFVTMVRMEDMARDVAEELPQMIRVTRYLEEAAELIPEINALSRSMKEGAREDESAELLQQLMTEAEAALALFQNEQEQHDSAIIALDKFQTAYQAAKASLLRAAALKKLSPEQAEDILDKLSHTRRAIEQMAKADRMLRNYHHEIVGKEDNSTVAA